MKFYLQNSRNQGYVDWQVGIFRHNLIKQAIECYFQKQKMKVLGVHKQTILLTLIDQDTINKQNRKHVFAPEVVQDNTSLDFTEIMERQWGLESEQVILSSKNKLQLKKPKQMIENANFFNEADNRELVIDRQKPRETLQQSRLPQIQTFFQLSKQKWDLDLYLQSSYFRLCIRFFVLIYFTGLLLTDYNFRLEQNNIGQSEQKKPLSLQNIISLHFQLLANCAFTLEILLKMFSKNKFFANPWNISTLIGCFSCWIYLSVDFQANDSSSIYQLVSLLKILLGVRVIQIFSFIKNPFQSFILTIPELSKIFFPYLIFILMYSVLGLILFYDANQHKCRQTQAPVNQQWPEVSPNLCGSQIFQCAVGYCGNPFDYGLPYNLTQKYELGNEFGLVNFENIGSSFLVVYHYVFLSNWTSIMYKFSKYLSPYMVTFYFFTLALFLFFIMSNLNMITMCKTFIEKQKQKQRFVVEEKKKKKEKLDPFLQIPQTILKILKILDYVELILIIFSAIVILIEYEGIKQEVRSLLNKIDFSLTIISLTFIILRTIMLKRLVFYDKLTILDWISIIPSIVDLVSCLVEESSIINPQNPRSRFMRGVKILRIIRIIYFSKSWFAFEKTILKMFVQTLETVKYFLLLLLCVTVILAMIGQNLFANLVRFDHETHLTDLQHGTSYFVNFDSLYKAIVAVITLLENERWTETMYNFYNVVGWKAVAYFTIVVFIIHLLLTRLFLAVFLCYFRRNLQKTSEIQQQLGNKKKLNNQQGSENSDAHIVEFLQKQSSAMAQDAKSKDQKEEKEKIFWVFQRDMSFFKFVRDLYNSLIFHRLLMVVIVIHCFTIILRTNQDTPEKTRILNIIEYFPLYFYVLELLIGVLGFGFFWGPNGYLILSKMNYVNVIVAVLVVVSEFNFLGQFQTSILRRLTIMKILSFFTRTNKETSIVLAAISAISERFIRMIIMYMFLLIISSLLPLKLASSSLSKCYNYGDGHNTPINFRQCMLMGGDWVRDNQYFSNIFSSLVLMYQIVTAESWTYYVENFNQSQPWDLFFVLNFFLYNLCLLNIFVGLTVETYLTLKDEAYKLNLLQPNQRMWLLIKNCINELIPVPMMKEPKTESKFRKIAYYIISQSIYENFIDLLPYLNILLYSLNYYRADTLYITYLQYASNTILAIFMIDTVLKLQLHRNFFYLDNSKIQFVGFLFNIAYIITLLTSHVDHEITRMLKSVAALLLILRCKKLLFRFTWSKTLLNSVLEVLPKCLVIGALLSAIIFFYISLGMEIFKYIKPTPKSDGYITGFNNAFTSLITLLKIVSNQSWFDQVGVHVRDSSPIDICFPINTIDDAILHPSMGCGSKAGYIYFISFHMIIALLVMNLLIATMVAAYDENYEKQYKSVNIFQLQDCLKLWQKYDLDGTGVIPYKKFWRLSSEIAILFGISKKKLIKGKQKFLEQLDVEVCQSIDPKSPKVLCYKFHDVLIKLSKIKLTVSKGECEENSEHMDFEIHPLIEKQIIDYVKKAPPLYENMKQFKNLKSGEMKYFLGLLRKMRAWKIVAKKKDLSVISKLSYIVSAALEKKSKQEAEIACIRSQNIEFMRDNGVRNKI